MARGTPSHVTGTLAAAVDAETQTDAFLSVLETQIAAYQSNSTDAWEVYDTVDAATATRDLVYLSVGDRTLASGAGDVRLFLRLTRTSTTGLQFQGYQDWSSTDSNGLGAALNTGFNVAANELDYWFSYNEYEFHCVFNQSTTWTYAGFASPLRTHVPVSHRGRCFSTASFGAGSSVVVSVDRDLTSSLQVGELVWLINQTDGVSSIESRDVEVAEVSAVTATTITFTSITASHPSGTLIGQDPAPFFNWAGINTADLTAYNTQTVSGGSSGEASVADNGRFEFPFAVYVSDSNEDPGIVGNFYIGQYPLMSETTTGEIGFRGELRAMSLWGQSTQTTADDNVDIISGVSWQPFPNLLHTSRSLNLFRA